jgi:hypothetical protein
MRKLTIGDVTITSIIERDGPWRAPGQMFPDAPADQIEATLKELEPETYDVASGKMVITYQTYVVRTPRHTILVDTCTGEDKGYPAPMDFPKQPWLDGLKAEGLSFARICSLGSFNQGRRNPSGRRRFRFHHELRTRGGGGAGAAGG